MWGRNWTKLDIGGDFFGPKHHLDLKIILDSYKNLELLQFCLFVAEAAYSCASVTTGSKTYEKQFSFSALLQQAEDFTTPGEKSSAWWGKAEILNCGFLV